MTVQLQRGIVELGEYPLLVAALGLAVGAALGGSLPPTETENRLIGETSDSLKRQAREMANAQFAEMTDAAGQIVENLQRQYAPPEADEKLNAHPEAHETPGQSAAAEARRQRLGPV